MSNPFLAEIIMFGGNFAPRGWAFCDGQLLAINSNQALFSLLGTTFGGDGRTSFGLPDLRGRSPMHAGSGPGLTPRSLGQKLGTQTNVLSVPQLPAHQHNPFVKTANAPGDANSPNGNGLASLARDKETAAALEIYRAAPVFGTDTLAGMSESNVGSNQQVNNIQPVQCINFIIALQGVFPSRN